VRRDLASRLNHYADFIVEVTKLKAGSRLVMANSRILVVDSNKFEAEDFVVLEKYEYAFRGKPLYDELASLTFSDLDADQLTSSWFSQLTWKISLLVNGGSKEYTREKVPRDVNPSFGNGFKDTYTFEVLAVVNPYSLEAQTISSILTMLDEVGDCKISVLLNPIFHQDGYDAPLKRFYRVPYSTELRFAEDGSILPAPHALFDHLPNNLLLTLGLDIHRAWLVFPKRSVHDLDNILLKDTDTADVESQFELKNLLVEGHCFDTTGRPPRGLQVMLGTSERPDMADTLVMANYGYFQMQANPGVWQVKIRPGRSTELYSFAERGTDSKLEIVNTFKGGFSQFLVKKQPGKEHENLIQEEPRAPQEDEGNSKSSSPHAEINIFSVASGHLYERFLRIMITSVMKSTQSTVKFWFIENFLSPSFKESLPAMAEHYKFDYQYVTYKWPKWLRNQKEKQRLIWGYKILFLDVLFPLDLDKVIYVDADQTVRGDLKELVDMNLHGAPYAYTPFCDSNRDTEGYRFWKSGWWAGFLSGKPYYISALYVVDLKRFRLVAAGDRLRGQYQQLSADPHSLANLDQDLPNHMQHQIAIHTLPQEWLWCETWCSKESLTTAKTIDLCNNPMTKEPKLVMAARIVKEWTDYDNEVKEVLREASVSEEHKKTRDEL